APVDQPAGVGSKAPRIRFEANGPETAGRIGLWARETLKATVGAPLTLTVWAADDFEPSLRGPAPVNLTWSKYQGPPEGMVVFAGGEAGEGTRGGPARAGPAAGAPGPVGRGGFGGGGGSGLRAPAEGGEVSTTATFSAPGDYVLRVEALASGRDSSNADQCCWTNGYVRVTVTP
ncbi:MAG TPA: hypothetical protein VMN39_11995, partial [Longimicrobiaceae bacterium]|nr:hypothetical protein [Longimicrobiaceae bacterium]